MTQNSNPFGRDLASVQTANGLDLDPALLEATGIDVLKQSVIRRQVTPRGSAVGAPNDGIDLRAYLGKGLTRADLAQLSRVIQQELLRDQRILDVVVDANYNPTTRRLTVQETFQTTAGPFSLTLSVSQVTVEVIKQSASGA